MAKKRAVAVVTFYVYGDTDQDLYNEAKRITKNVNVLEDCRASVEELHDAPFGVIKSEVKKIDISKLKH